uniref:Putative periplasmic protein n=1 Tax=Escherichia coli TaxID=562 RepID=A0A6G6AK67_ECOLX|nr:putative periplasmic protein [Escherichia coli]
MLSSLTPCKFEGEKPDWFDGYGEFVRKVTERRQLNVQAEAVSFIRGS